MAKLKSTLEAHKVTLGLALDMISFTALRDVQHDTFAAKQNTEVIMRDSKEILEAIAKLQTKSLGNSREISNSYSLSRYLNELTTYTESVYEYAESNLEEISIFSPTDTHQSLPSSPAIIACHHRQFQD
ncbi:uncharacterized protein CTRU02_210863 [Colletotrichum truncatum]|uniref:Uncharacterized protein n=1 Tax=Colletotrichum truncatum TaxID=5467 RepID=A0ACC3YQ55_COLTU